jgi:hypothetical protein
METSTAGVTVWAEFQLRVPGFFEQLSGLLPDAVTIVFKMKPCSSPESSPSNSPERDDSQLLVLQQSLSESRLVEVISSSSSEHSSLPLSPRGYRMML